MEQPQESVRERQDVALSFAAAARKSKGPTGWNLFLLSLGLVIILGTAVVPWDYFVRHWQALVLASTFGALVGITEISTRYRDEPLLAVTSPFGCLYVFINATISFAATLLIFRFSGTFPSIARDGCLAALAGGFGGAAVMRTRLAIIKNEAKEDVAVGPDAVIKAMLTLCDLSIDRYRAQSREKLVLDYLPLMRQLGTVEALRQSGTTSFAQAAGYLIVSVLAFQNVDKELKSELEEAAKRFSAEQQPDDIKFLAFSYYFLNLVGETQFCAVLEHAAQFFCTVTATPVQVSPQH